MVTNKKLLSLLLVFVILLSSANAALAVSAAGHSVNLELFGGTLTDYTQGSTLPTYEQISKDGWTSRVAAALREPTIWPCATPSCEKEMC